MTFKVGDRVVWCGVPGVVIKDWKFKSELSASLEVEFDALDPKGEYKLRHNFLGDGRLLPWHPQPSLKLVELSNRHDS